MKRLVEANSINEIYVLSCLTSKSIVYMDTETYNHNTWKVMIANPNHEEGYRNLSIFSINNIQNYNKKNNIKSISYLNAITTDDNLIIMHLNDNILQFNVEVFNIHLKIDEDKHV